MSAPTPSVEDLSSLGWTAVTERLPQYTEDRSKFLLCYSSTHDWMGARYAIIRQADFYAESEEGAHGTWDTDAVTHWMELPEEPR